MPHGPVRVRPRPQLRACRVDVGRRLPASAAPLAAVAANFAAVANLAAAAIATVATAGLAAAAHAAP